jgi:hypothetical protein
MRQRGIESMTRIAPTTYRTKTETAEIAQQAQRLYALADKLVARAERLRQSAETLISSAHVEVHLKSVDLRGQRTLDLGPHERTL